MSKKGEFLIVSNTDKSDKSDNYFLIRNKLHKALYENNLIEELSLEDDNFVEIKETDNKAILKKVIINELNHQREKSEIKRIWKINLENDILGISTKGKTTEIALLVLEKFEGENYRLNVILIELKSSLQPSKSKSDNEKSQKKSSLSDIELKFQHSMNRLYLLLSLNNHQNPQKRYDKTTIQVRFVGAIFYNKNETTKNNDDSTQLYKMLHQISNNLLTLETIIKERDKIEVKFFQNQDSKKDNMSVSLKELM